MTRLLLALSLTLSVTAVRAEVESGPKPGVAVPTLKVAVIVGGTEGLDGKDADYAKKRGDKPTVYALVNAEKFDRPLAQLLRKLDEKISDTADAEVVAVWVGDDATKSKEYIPRMQQSIKLTHTALAVAPDAQPDGWALNPDAHVTVVVVVKGKVVKSFPLVSVNEKDAAKVLEALTKAAKK